LMGGCVADEYLTVHYVCSASETCMAGVNLSFHMNCTEQTTVIVIIRNLNFIHFSKPSA